MPLGQEIHNIHDELIKGSLNGNKASQYKLYNLYCKAMFNVCYRIINDVEDAQDVLQEAFVSAFRNLSSYKATATFGAWLKRIVVNKAINHLNKKRIDSASFDSEYDIADEYEQDVFIDVKLTVNKVKKAMNKLPDGYRLVFSLYVVEGYDHTEIAQILGITESTSKSQLNRSKKKLRELIEREEVYEE